MKTIFYYRNIDDLLLEIAEDQRLFQSKVVLTGGYFNPLHVGHILLLEESKLLGDLLIVAVNSDDSAIQKSGYSFMPFEDRMAIVSSLCCVDIVVENPCGNMASLINYIRPDVYTKGGDVTEVTLALEEKRSCADCGCIIKYGVGGGKMESSSGLLAKYREFISNKNS